MAHKLLLADDSITIQKVVELTLSEEGFEVTAVGDGEAAYETAKNLNPDIILADVFMPKLDGYELCRKLKSDPALSGIPVLLLYGTFEDFDDMKAAQVGASDSLTKPFESVDLIGKVKALAGVKLAGGAPAPALEEAPVAEAEPILEAEPEMVVAEPVDAGGESDDLWSEVGMGEEGQPLSDATDVLTEEELWKRAKLTQDESAQEAPAAAAEQPQAAQPGEGMFWDDMPTESVEPIEEAEPMYAEEAPEAEDKTAVLNMEELQASVQATPPAPAPDPEPIELAPAPEEVEITTFDSLQDATAGDEYARSEPAAPPAAPPAVEPTVEPVAAPAAAQVTGDVREQVIQAAGDIIQDKLKEALTGMSRELIEQIAWEVIPDLAEEIINREIQKMKSGT